MKKITFFGLFLLLGVLFSPLLAKADIIPDNSHSINRCEKIVNIDEFPDISLVGYVEGPMIRDDGKMIIKNNECLDIGYKLNTVTIYWTEKDKTNIKNESNILIKNWVVFDGYVNKDDPRIKETTEYILIKNTNGKYILHKNKIISEYNNGKAPTTKILPAGNIQKVTNDIKKGVENGIQKVNDGINEVKNIQKRGFWSSVWCFFGLTRYCD